MLYVKELERNLRVCHKCQYHFQLATAERIALLIDPGCFAELDAELAGGRSTAFSGIRSKNWHGDREKTGLQEAFKYGDAEIAGVPTVLAWSRFRLHRGGSMGSIVGEKVTRALERGVELAPSGGDRRHLGRRAPAGRHRVVDADGENIGCRRALKAAGQLYIVIMTDPTYAGVLASFASLGDIIITEPGTRIGFASPHMIEQNLKSKMPAGTQSAEFQLSHGMVDMVVHRRELRSVLGKLLNYLAPAPPCVPAEKEQRSDAEV